MLNQNPGRRKRKRKQTNFRNYRKDSSMVSHTQAVLGPYMVAYQQLLWYAVPNRTTRFIDLQEAEDIQFTRIELQSLRDQLAAKEKELEDRFIKDGDLQQLKEENTKLREALNKNS